MIEARNLSKRYGPVRAVHHLSFEVGPGRVTGFLGPTGAGKSTTMRLILGLKRPAEGSLTVDGHRYVDARFRSTGSVPSWTRLRCTAGGEPSTTTGGRHRATASLEGASRRYSTWSG